MEVSNNPDQRFNRYRTFLRCPVCRGGLEDGSQTLLCRSCNAAYPLIQGRPVLLTEPNRRELDTHLETVDGQRMIREYSEPPAAIAPSISSRCLNWLRPPPVMHRYHPDLRRPPTAVLFEQEGTQPPLTLNVGGGPTRVSAHEITLNIRPFQNVDLVADAHNIPFADNAFDAVFTLSVLEHVGDPYKVVAEMFRVLKPGDICIPKCRLFYFFMATRPITRDLPGKA